MMAENFETCSESVPPGPGSAAKENPESLEDYLLREAVLVDFCTRFRVAHRTDEPERKENKERR